MKNFILYMLITGLFLVGFNYSMDKEEGKDYTFKELCLDMTSGWGVVPIGLGVDYFNHLKEKYPEQYAAHAKKHQADTLQIQIDSTAVQGINLVNAD